MLHFKRTGSLLQEWAEEMFLPALAVNSDTGRVFGVKENAQANTARNKRTRPTHGFSETRELGCVVTARRGTKECQYAGDRTQQDRK